MSFLEKIRKNTWLIFFLISISLVFFILDPNIILKFFSKNPNVIGKVNGDDIYLEEYLSYFRFLKRFREGTPDYLLKDDAWKLLVHEKVLNQQAERLGIQKTEKDFWDTMEKQSIYSKIIDFQDEKGKMDINKFKLYLSNLYRNNNINSQIEEERNIWDSEKRSINRSILSKKYVEMLMYGLNTSSIEAELNYKEKNSFSIIDYIFIPYSEIDNKYFCIKSNDIRNYIGINKYLYKKEDLRNLSFVIIRSHPSLDDEKNMNLKIKELFHEFKHSNYNSIIVSRESEKPFDSNFYLKKNLPIPLQYFIEKNNQIGSMFGPVKENNIYIIAKLTGKKIIHNLVLPRQILICHKKSIRFYNRRSKKEAERIAKNIYNTVKKNPETFNSFVMKKSDDFFHVKKNRGSLGWIKYGEQNNTGNFDIFSFRNKIGKVGLFETKFGYHIIRIDDKKDLQPVYQFSIIIKKLIPSKKTEESIYRNVIRFIKENKTSNLNTFINNARKKRYETIFLEEIKNVPWKWNIHGLNTGLDKEIINWSYEKKRKKGDIKVFSTVNKDYVIVFLSKIQKKGFPIEELKNNLIPILINKKIENFFSKNRKKFFHKNLEDIALFFSKKINKYCKINFYYSMIENYQEPKVVGAAFSSKLYETSKPILGNRGIFFIRPLKRFYTYKNPSYFSYEIEYLNSFLRKSILEKLGDVLIKQSKIKDFRKNV
ncbi:SurA N-terminal domain-containing protein [Blattabacterium cuenoti]|uniref:SurA N-terminal domain-containing protein n=1 Tax=Blattabacterium cuenoti TaxID=1653831 RepID=UPI00163B659D|nr:SurA N-terminal domain-containing protein [Blattabacterium cuenoti]